MKPPVEGARWGDDPAPPPPPVHVPPEPSKEEILRRRYGETNVQRALDIQESLRTDYPFVALLRMTPADLVEDILNYAESSVAHAAADGRLHSMPETLEKLAGVLARTLAANPDITSLRDCGAFVYGDESKGHAAKRPPAKRTRERAGFVLFRPLMQTFSIRGRSRRAEFAQFGFAYIALLFVVPVLVKYDLYLLAAQLGQVTVALNLILLPSMITLCIRRMHDVGKSGGWLILWAVFGFLPLPILGLIPGDYGSNKFGADPKGDPVA